MADDTYDPNNPFSFAIKSQQPGIAQALTPEEQLRIQRIQQGQQLIRALSMRNLEPQQGQMVSGWYVRPSPLAGLAQMASGIFGMNAANKGDTDVANIQTQAAQRYKTGADAERQQITGLVQSDPEAALRAASSSQYPQNRALGASINQMLQRRQGLTEKVLPDLTPDQRVQVARGKNLPDIAPNLYEYYDTGNGTLGVRAKQASPTATVAPIGPRVGQAESVDAAGTPMRVNVPPSGMQIPVDQFHTPVPSPVSGIAPETINKQLLEARTEFDENQKALQINSQTLQSLREGARSGQIEPTLQTLRKYVTSLTGQQYDSTVPTERLMQLLSSRTLAASGGRLGAGFSDADREFMRQASLGSIRAEPSSIERVIAIDSANRLQRNRTLQTDAANYAGLDPNRGPNILRAVWGNRDALQIPDHTFSTDAAANAFARVGLGQTPEQLPTNTRELAPKIAPGTRSTTRDGREVEFDGRGWKLVGPQMPGVQ